MVMKVEEQDRCKACAGEGYTVGYDGFEVCRHTCLTCEGTGIRGGLTLEQLEYLKTMPR